MMKNAMNDAFLQLDLINLEFFLIDAVILIEHAQFNSVIIFTQNVKIIEHSHLLQKDGFVPVAENQTLFIYFPQIDQLN